jgi:hypothetical protein
MATEEIHLKEYFEKLLIERDKAIERAQVSMEKRLDAMNEIRDALRDQAARSPTRVEVDARLDAIDRAIDELKTYKAIAESKASSWLVWVGLFFTGAAFFISIYNAFLK